MTFKWDYELLTHSCFDDRSVNGWIDGTELLRNLSWDNSQRKRWFYFYRPHNINIGEPQLKEIGKIDKLLSEETMKQSVNSILMLAFIILTGTALLREKFLLINLFSISMLILLLRRIYLGTIIAGLNQQKEILAKKIQELYKQCNEINKNLVSDEYIEQELWSDIRDLEKFFMARISFKNFDRVKKDAADFYKAARLDFHQDIKLPLFPVIPTWALLQPSQRVSIDGEETVGINKVFKEIGGRVASWRNVKNGKTFFRLWHLHFLFFQEKNIDIVSVYYDFISKRPYNVYMETYQYNHITNYSYVELDISGLRDSIIIKNINLPENLTDNIFSNEVKALSFSSSSGSYYTCILPDRDVAIGLEKWLKYKQHELDTEIQASDSKFPITAMEKEQIFNQKVSYDSLSETIASESLKMLRSKVENFAIKEKNHIKRIET